MDRPRNIFRLLGLVTDSSKYSKRSEYTKLWNISFLFLSIFFFFVSLFDFIWISSVLSYTFFLMGVFFFYMIFTDLKFNKEAQIFAYLFLSFVIFYVASHTSLNSGVYLFYVPLIILVPIFLSFKEDRGSIFLVSFFVVFELVLVFTTNTSKNANEKAIFIESLSVSLFLMCWVVYFILRIQWLQFKDYKHKHVTKTEESKLDESKIKEVLDMARRKDNLFFSHFKNLYPHFCERLVELQPTVASSELEFCAYLKLNFTTKEIARYTNSSIRSIEGKKYRIRKKYNIPEKSDIYVFMGDL